jgi:type IV pilus assembly protein PilN
MALRIPINLATEPFRRDRPMLAGAAAIATLLSLLLIFQVFTIVSEHRQAADIRVAIVRENAQIRVIAAQQDKLNATLRKPENAEVLERSLFLNTLIDRKAISWTKIFADLEKIMPYNVRLVSVRLPAVNSNNQVLLDMVVGAKDVEPILELFKRLEGSPQFGNASVQTSTPPSQTDPFYRYHVTVSYAQRL